MSPEAPVASNTEPVCAFDAAALRSLSDRTRRLGRSCRYCLHRSHGDPTQEMVIAHLGGTYVRPHRHGGRSVSYHMVSGSLTFWMFDDAGIPNRRIELSAPGAELPFLLRLCDNSWYMPIARTDIAVFHETITGPFETEGFTEWAPWSPEASDPESGRRFIESTERSFHPKDAP